MMKKSLILLAAMALIVLAATSSFADRDGRDGYRVYHRDFGVPRGPVVWTGPVVVLRPLLPPPPPPVLFPHVILQNVPVGFDPWGHVVFQLQQRIVLLPYP